MALCRPMVTLPIWKRRSNNHVVATLSASLAETSFYRVALVDGLAMDSIAAGDRLPNMSFRFEPHKFVILLILLCYM